MRKLHRHFVVVAEYLRLVHVNLSAYPFERINHDLLTNNAGRGARRWQTERVQVCVMHVAEVAGANDQRLRRKTAGWTSVTKIRIYNKVVRKYSLMARLRRKFYGS